MKSAARLIDVRVPPNPEGAVLVLHGGGGRTGNMMVSPTQLSVLRMIPIAGRIARRGSGRLAVYRLLNSVRGWDSKHTPVLDAQWAMGQIADRLGKELPVGLVGHSLGGRAALLAADSDQVCSAVALAPWLDNSDIRSGPVDKKLLIVHGSRDRIASASRALAVAQSLSDNSEVGYIRIEGGKHAMLRHHARFDGYAADFAVATLLGESVGGPVAQVLNGQPFISV